MALTVRGEELGSLVELMETLPEELSIEQMANAIFHRVAWLLSMRESHAVVVAGRQVFGPIHGESEAEKLAELLSEFGTRRVTLLSPGEIAARLSPDGTHWVGFCVGCGHPENMHMMKGSSPHGGECGYLKAAECDCEQYVKFAPRKATTRKKKAGVAPVAEPEDAAA